MAALTRSRGNRGLEGPASPLKLEEGGQPPRVMHVSRHDPGSMAHDRDRSQGNGHRERTPGKGTLTPLISPNVPKSLPSAVPRPITAGEMAVMSASASLPSLTPNRARPDMTPATNGTAKSYGEESPHIEDLKIAREMKALRNRNKELESELRRTTNALQKTRQLQQMQSTYGREPNAPSAWGDDSAMLKQKLPVGAVDAATFARMRAEWEATLQQQKVMYEQRVASANMMHEQELMHATGGNKSQQDEVAMIQAKAREERVELLRRQIARRMLNRDLTLGWQCWLEMYEAKVYALGRLRVCAQRLKSPQLAEAFGVWLRGWQMTIRVKEQREAEERAKSLLGESETLQEEVVRLRHALEMAQDDKEKALERQLIEISGSHEERMAIAAEKEKEERVELLRRQFGRRMMNRDMAAGWDAWYELWSAKAYALQRLREVGNRFRSPELSNAFAFWQSDFENEKHRAEKALLEKQSKSLEAQLRQARFEVGQSGMVKVALEDEVKALKDKVSELSELSKTSMASAATASALQKTVEDLNEQNRVAEAEAELASKKRQDAEEDAARQRAEDKKLLEKLLAEQRKAFEVELEGIRADINAENEARAKEERIELLRRQVTRRILNRDLARGWQCWQEMYNAKVYAQNRLREVGNHFRAPELAKAFDWWVKYHALRGERTKLNEATRKIGQLGKTAEASVRMQEEFDVMRGELAEVTRQRDALRERLNALDGGASEAAAMHEAQLMKEREERVELLTRQVARRMLNASLSSAWSAWADFWNAKVYAMQRLKQAASRFRSPELGGAFYHWELRWRSTVQARLERERVAALTALGAESNKVTDMATQLATTKKQLDAAHAELQELRGSLRQVDGGVTEAARLHQEQLEGEREQRIELFRRQIARRMLHTDLASAWQSWLDFWDARSYALQRLREASNRLRAPELQEAFQRWQRLVTAMHTMHHVRELRAQAGGEQARATGLAGQLEALREEMRVKLAAAEEDKRAALQRQMTELTGSSAQQLALEEGKAKEERVELLRRQFGRRMLNRDLSSGFTAWLDMWTARIDAKERLRKIGNRFKAPELMIAFEQWDQACYAAKQAKKLAAAEALKSQLEAERVELSSDLAKVKAEYEDKLRKAEAARVLLLEKISLLSGGANDAEELRTAQRALDKEKRVEKLREQMARRMLNSGLVHGWGAWHEMWQAKRDALNRLRQVGNRFKAPALSEAFELWVAEWVRLVKAVATKKRLAELRSETDRAQSEALTVAEQMQSLKSEMAAKLKKAEEEKNAALQRQVVELTGSSEERLALASQQEKEARIELLRRQISRRMFNRQLARGWQCYLEFYQSKTYAMSRLQKCAQKLKSPELATAFEFWQSETYEAKRQQHVLQLEKLSKSLEAQLRQSRHEVGQANMIKIANADEIVALREKLTEAHAEVRDREARVAILRIYEREVEDLRLTQQAALDAQKISEEKKVEAEEDSVKQRESDKELLERLLAEQRRDFMQEQEAARERLKAQADERKAYEDQITDLTKSMTMNTAEREKAEAALKDEISKLKAEIMRLRKPKPVKAKAGEGGVKPSPLGKMDLDEGPDAPPISQQLAAALKKNSARVLDLFRSWDADGDGEVSRAEFHKAMPALGLEVPKKDIDDLFSEWDKDGGGALGLRELQKILAQSNRPPPKPAEKVQEAAGTAMATMGALSAFKKKAAAAKPAE